MWCIPRLQRRQSLATKYRNRRILALGLALGVAVVVHIDSVTRRPGWTPACALTLFGRPLGQLLKRVDSPPDSASMLAKAWRQVDQLSVRVARRGIVPGFGWKAAAIVRAVVAGGIDDDAKTLEKAIDGPLEVLFLQQLSVLAAQAVDLYDAQMVARPNPLKAALDAQAFFDKGLEDLRRPGSSWSAQVERDDLLAQLGESYSRDIRLMDEQAKQGQGKQVTMEVIRKLQQQTADVHRQVEKRGAFPWNVKWQYMVENSPFGFRGQYKEGRSVLEMMLTPSLDPRQKDKLLNKIGPLNLAVAFDMLM